MRLSCHVKDRKEMEATLTTYTSNMAKMLEYFRREGTLEVKSERERVPTFCHIIRKKRKKKRKSLKNKLSEESLGDIDIDTMASLEEED